MKIPKHILTTIVIAQFFCSSIWFAGNGVMSDLTTTFNLDSNALGHLTAVVQFGFITGTLVFALLTIADRYSPSKVFFICALFGAFFNIGVIWENNTLTTLLILRFLTGFSLAGIYPVGMKIAADYFQKGLGLSLGFLVGALVIGTAFPHLLKGITATLAWQIVILITTGLAIIGGFLMFFLVKDGPHRRASQQFSPTALITVFKKPKFRAAAFGYFGHMWELYTFWAFIPIILTTYQSLHPNTAFNIPILSFSIIAIGGIACAVGGYISQYAGTKQTAFTALLLSGCCCLLLPVLFKINTPTLFLLFLLFWGIVVVADSPLFSTLVAQNAEPTIKGTALTIVNSIGFLITIFSIQLMNYLQPNFDTPWIYTILALGPIFGLISLSQKIQN